MNESVVRSAFIKMNAGNRRQTSWFIAQGLSKNDLFEAVDRGYLVYYEKDPNDFMSNDGYVLTQAGQDFVWSK